MGVSRGELIGVRVGTVGTVSSKVGGGAVGVKAGVRALVGDMIGAGPPVGEKAGDAKSARF